MVPRARNQFAESVRRFRGAAAGALVIAISAQAGDILYVHGNSGLTATDLILVDIMAELGHTTTKVASSASAASQAAGKSLVYISNSASSSEIGTKFKTVEVPVLSTKHSNWPTMGLILAGEGYTYATPTMLIADSAHPMAAGFKWTVPVYNSSLSSFFGKVGGGAQVVTLMPGSTNKAGLFGYENGATLSDGSTAAARRVGLFLYEIASGDLTTAGREIIKAAIGWSMSNSPPNIVQNPLNQTIKERQAGFFSTAAVSILPLSYQWYKNGSAISGATQSSYTTPGSVLADSGAVFRCVITNSAGLNTTDSAVLHVLPRPTPKSSELVSVAGDLHLADGTPVGSGATAYKDITVKLHTALTGGSPLHTETFLAAHGKAAAVKDGRFVVRLGLGHSATEARDILPAHPDLYAEFAVGDTGATQETLAPRVPVTSPAYLGSPLVTRGAGAPSNPAQIGTLYQNLSDNSVWIRMAQTWVRISN